MWVILTGDHKLFSWHVIGMFNTDKNIIVVENTVFLVYRKIKMCAKTEIKDFTTFQQTFNNENTA
jgi:hypothetical protein